MLARSLAVVLLVAPMAAQGAEPFTETYCVACHRGDSPAGGLRLDDEDWQNSGEVWSKVQARVAAREMPPKGAPAPDSDQRERFLERLRTLACAGELRPRGAAVRRLNRDEYAATVRDLFDIQLDVAELLPEDGPGGEGFDNAAETLFLTPLHSEKYLDVARVVTDAASKEYKSRTKIFVARPGDGVDEVEAARRVLRAFLPRAFRRPVDGRAVEEYLALFRRARKLGKDFEPAVFFALRGVLASPRFLFHVTAPEGDERLRQYALASRFSYFLWGSMPDELLFDAATAGKMDSLEVLARLIPRMLRDPRSLEFSERFVEQWLRTRELDRGGPDLAELSDYADTEDLRSDIRLQPVFFFQQVFRENLSLLDFLDSERTIMTRSLDHHFGIEREERTSKNPTWLELSPNSNRGGLLGMPAVLAVSSHPSRTSPVLRGTWILDSILGASPPPPPPDVPDLEESQSEEAPKSMRELLASHRADAACAGCHDRIDPLGLALDNYDVVGRWRDEEDGHPIDVSGELTDGTKVNGPAELKAALLERKELFIRNLTKRMLGYALGRGLTHGDACAVERIVEGVAAVEYRSQGLLQQIVISEPFLESAVRK